MANCTYQVLVDGQKQQFNLSEFKAWLVDGGLDRLFPGVMDRVKAGQNEVVTKPDEVPTQAEQPKGTFTAKGSFISSVIDDYVAKMPASRNKEDFKNNIIWNLNNATYPTIITYDSAGNFIAVDRLGKSKILPNGNPEQFNEKTSEGFFEKKLIEGIDNGTASYNAKAKKRYDELMAEKNKQQEAEKAKQDKAKRDIESARIESQITEQQINEKLKQVKFVKDTVNIETKLNDKIVEVPVSGIAYKDLIVAKKPDSFIKEKGEYPYWVYSKTAKVVVSPDGFKTQELAKVFAMRMADAMPDVEKLNKSSFLESLKTVNPEVGYSAYDYYRYVKNFFNPYGVVKPSNTQPNPTQAIEAEVSKPTAKAKIEDTGEKFGGAKKDKAAFYKKEITNDDYIDLPLSKLWPKSEINEIDNPKLKAMAYVARSIIPTAKPKTTYKLNKWIDQVKFLRNFIKDFFDNESKIDTFDKQVGLNDTLKSIKNKYDVISQLPMEQWDRIGDISLYPFAYRYDENNNKIPSPSAYIYIDGRGNRIDGAKTIEDTIDPINKLLGNAVQPKKMAFEIRGRGDKYFINKKGDSEYRHLKDFSNLDEARVYLKNNYNDLVQAWEDVKNRDNVNENDLRPSENRPRSSEDFRKGKDISSEDFIKTFGFRGAEFGNWVSQGGSEKERQGMINSAYDALMDLAKIIDVPEKALSLNGSLGIAFGSRGSGRASAHYEPNTVVINLTKTRGAGTLAHEWFHALDNYFASFRGKVPFNGNNKTFRQDNYITYKPEKLYTHKGYNSGEYLTWERLKQLSETSNGNWYNLDNWHVDPNYKEGVRPVVEAKFANLVEKLNESPMAKRAAKADKSDDYWSRIIERAARAFENYIIAKMADEGYHNDYLANVTKVEAFNKDSERYPYLLDSELEPVKQAFDELFDTLETKETDKGLMLFSRNQSTTQNPHTESTLTQAFRKALDKAFGDGFMDRLVGTGKFKVISLAEAKALIGDKVKFHKVWHGSESSDFDAFNESFIGDSNGTAFGWGAYVTNDRKNAEFYWNKKAGGKLYQIEADNNEDHYLHLDKTLDEQSDYVKKVLKDNSLFDDKNTKGMDLYESIAEDFYANGNFLSDSQRLASKKLLEIGIAGNVYDDGLIGSGTKSFVVFDVSKLSIEAKYSKNGYIVAFYNPADDTSYFVADNISQDATDQDLKGLVLHETAVHALQLGKDSKEFKAILDQVKALHKAGNEAVVAAFKQVPKDTKPEHFWEEVLAYLTQHSPDLSIVQKFIAWFKSQLRKLSAALPGTDRAAFMRWANNLNEKDLVYMANAALKSAPDSLMFDNHDKQSGIKARAYHYGVQDFNKFDMNFVGSGVGKAVRGYGAYVTDTKEIAEMYRDGLHKDTGKLYQMDVKPESNQYLDWDKPLNQQSNLVKEIVNSLPKEVSDTISGAMPQYRTKGAEYLLNEPRFTGGVLYNYLAKALGSPKAASEYLLSRGIHGNTYLDNPSSTSRDYVLFDANDMDIEAKFSKAEAEYLKQYREIYDKYHGTDQWLKAPNGKPSRLNEVQWVQTRTKAFKDWFGDWETDASIKELISGEPFIVTGNEFANFSSEPLNMRDLRKKAFEYGSKNVAGIYRNNASGLNFEVRNSGIEQVIQHGSGPDKLKAIAAIPEIIKTGVVTFDGVNPKNKQGRLVTVSKLVVIGSKPFAITAGFREDSNGRLLYDHELFELKRADGISSQPSDKLLLNHPAPTSTRLNDYYSRFIEKNKFDEVSKIVDDNGEPMVLYHGTMQDIKDGVFKDSYHSNISLSFFTDSPKTASIYSRGFARAYQPGSNIIPVFVSLKNPKELDFSDREDDSDIRSEAYLASDENYDGLIVTNAFDGRRSYDTQYVTFNPNQIKSATGNTGAFSTEDNDIRFSRSVIPDTVRETLTPAPGKKPLGWLAQLFQRNHLMDFAVDAMKGMEGAIADKITQDLKDYKLYSQQKDNLVNHYDRDIDLQYNAMKDDMTAAQARELGRVQGMATRLEDFDPDKSDGTNLDEDQQTVYDAFQALPEKSKEVYRTMREDYRKDLVAKRNALIERINDFPADRTTKAEIVKSIEQHYDKFLKKGVYFPLSRFGDTVVTMKKFDANGKELPNEKVVAFVNGQKEAYALVKEMKTQGYSHAKITLKTVYDAQFRQTNAANEVAALAAKTFEALRKGDIDVNDKDAFTDELDQINQLLIDALPDVSYRKHFIHRKGTLGYSEDTLRAYANTRHAAAKNIAALKFDHKITKALSSADSGVDKFETSDDYDLNVSALRSVIDELKTRETKLKSTDIQPWAQQLTSLGFFGALGFNISSAAVNLLQVPGVALPDLAGKYGVADATNAISSAYKLIFNPNVLEKQAGFNLIKHPAMGKPEHAALKKALEQLQDNGKIDLTMTHDAVAMGQNPSYSDNAATRAVGGLAKYSGYLFHVAEAVNRQIVAVAAFNLEYKKSQNYDKALQAATDAIDNTQFDYSQGNRARFMMSNGARVLTLFKAYALGMSYFIGRNMHNAIKGETPEIRLAARKTLAVQMAMTFALSGVAGLPIGAETFAALGGMAGFRGYGSTGAVAGSMLGLAVFQALLAGLGADDDDDLETNFRNWLTDHFDQDVAEFITKGPMRLLPFGDISGRTGLDHLWWRPQNKELEGKDQYNAFANALLGPIGSQVAGLFTAQQLYQDGRYERMLESMLPRSVSNLIASGRLFSQGAKSLSGDKLINRELTLGEIFNKALGFNPTVIANATDANAAIIKKKTKIDNERKHLMNRYRDAKGADRIALLRGDIAKFNQTVPKADQITPAFIRRSLMSSRSIDKQTKNGLYLARKRDYLRSEGRFAENE